MAEPASLRVVRIVAEWLAEDPDLPDEVPLDLRDFSHDVPDEKKPALFVCIRDTDIPLDRETGRGVKDPLAVDIVGYVKAATEDDGGAPIIPPAVTEARERFLQLVLRRLASGDDAVDSLVKRLQDDRHTVGSGAESFEQLRPVRRQDLGERPPWGGFTIPCLAWLHYEQGEF